MQITTVDPAAGHVLAELHELVSASYRIDRPHRPPPVLAETTVDWTIGYCGAELAGLQARLDGRLAGYAAISLPMADNTFSAELEIVVHPELRRHGIGRDLAAAARDRITSYGRKVAIGTALAGSPGARFAVAVGAAAQQDRFRNVLYLDSLDSAAVAAGLAEARRRAAGYSLEYLTGPIPAACLADTAALYDVVNDAPHESEALEDEVWTGDRVAAEDRWRAARGETVCTILARSDATGEPAGMTRLAVRAAGDLALQLETAVARPHRGRRLGYLLKASMLGWLGEHAPQARRISTFNAVTNAHMIAVNEALGFVPVERWTFYELAMSPLGQPPSDGY
jgi:GNAT superfamily N-acetyltransferase